MRVLIIALLAWLGAAPQPAARADDLIYPKAAPVLSVTMPDAWATRETDGASHMLLCAPPGDENYTIIVMTLPTVGNGADLKAILARLAHAGAVGAGMTDITVPDAREETIGNGPRVFTRVTASGKHQDEASAYSFYAFPVPRTGKYYALGVAGLQVMIDAHRSEFEAVARSIRPVR